MPRILLPLLLLAVLGTEALAQTQLPIMPFDRTYSDATRTRGYWFQAPVDFTITGLQVPDETMDGTQNVEVFIMGMQPPSYPTTASGGSVFYAAGMPSSSIIPCSIPVSSGDYVGVIGACGTGTMHNSYGASGGFMSSIGGAPVTLERFGTQSNINVAPAPDYWTELGGAPSRVDLWYTQGPSCSINSPAMGAMVSGTVNIDYDVDHITMMPLDATFEYSLDMGMTWQPATATGTSVNPRLGIPTPSTGLVFEWDSLTDGVGLVMVESADFRIQVSDGATTVSCSVTGLQVDNVAPPPSCTLTRLSMGTASGVIDFELVPDSFGGAMLDAVLEYSADGGATWLPASPGGASMNPMIGLPSMTPALFEWDSRLDGVGAMALAPGVQLRATVDDGSPLTGECTTMPFDVDNTSLCQGLCGDCNLNVMGPDVLDALLAAQFAAGLMMPTPAHLGCCDVNASGTIEVLDALRIAQDAAGLMVSLTCL